MDAGGRREVELVAGRDLEGVVPAIDVAHDAVDPEFRRAMRVRENALPERLLPGLETPNLSVAEEEALVAGESVENRRLGAVERQMIGGLRDGESREVGDVLAERQAAVHVQPRNRGVGIELCDEIVGAPV